MRVESRWARSPRSAFGEPAKSLLVGQRREPARATPSTGRAGSAEAHLPTAWCRRAGGATEPGAASCRTHNRTRRRRDSPFCTSHIRACPLHAARNRNPAQTDAPKHRQRQGSQALPQGRLGLVRRRWLRARCHSPGSTGHARDCLSRNDYSPPHEGSAPRAPSQPRTFRETHLSEGISAGTRCLRHAPT
jgi:hypothetical protein